MKNKILLLALAGFTITAILSVVSQNLTPLPAILLLVLRWA